MRTFRSGRLRDFKLPLSTVWLLSDIAEAKGRQDLYTKQSPHDLTDSSHAAEGRSPRVSRAGPSAAWRKKGNTSKRG
jgi:hypothetical protein